MKQNRRNTVEDVAREANVSVATVSRVFNGTAKVREATERKVKEAARRLDYQPSRVARRLRVKSTDSLIIGLIVTDLANPFFSEIERGVEDIAYKNNNAVMVCNSDEDEEKERFYIETLLSERVSGLIVAPTPGNEAYIQELQDNGYPVVFVDRKPSYGNVDTVLIDNVSGAYSAIKRLLELGHRRIGIINGIPGITTTEERFAGYKKALQEYQIAPDPELVTYGNSRQSGGMDNARKLLELDNPPTAIFSTNNLMTLGVLEEMYNRGITIPDEIALIGFDDMPWAVALNPPLTAVKQPSYDLGTMATDLLLKRLEDPARSTSSIVLSPRLVIRKSCGSERRLAV